MVVRLFCKVLWNFVIVIKPSARITNGNLTPTKSPCLIRTIILLPTFRFSTVMMWVHISLHNVDGDFNDFLHVFVILTLGVPVWLILKLLEIILNGLANLLLGFSKFLLFLANLLVAFAILLGNITRPRVIH